MSARSIQFFEEEIKYNLKNKRRIRSWLLAVIEAEGYVLEELNFIFCSDTYLLGINQQFLDHDTYTDVITFDNSEGLKTIAGDIFISIERVYENAGLLRQSVPQELCRVMIHGTLHLLGYKDKSKAAKKQMTEREDHYLEKLDWV